MKDFLIDEQVEMEIKRLRESPNVELAQKELRIKRQRRHYMYTLRFLEKRGKQLAAEGVTIEELEACLAEFSEED